MKKVGIFGGTFDPIHIGHMIAADQALFYADLDEIWFMPAQIPPHKRNSNITHAIHRLEMLKRVVKLDNRYKLCTIELERSGPSYTLDTMKELQKKFHEYSFSFIIGGDMIEYLPKWYGIEELVQLVQFIGLKRPGFHHFPKNDEGELVYKFVKMIPMPQLEVSSSLIREWIKNGRSIRYIVDDSVEEYIKEQRLYEI